MWNRLTLLDDSTDTLVTLDRYQIIVPEGTRKEVLDLLHIPHQGQTKTYMAATIRYYWPKMKEEVIKKWKIVHYAENWQMINKLDHQCKRIYCKETLRPLKDSALINSV